jgi:hypothetical protein
VNKRLWQLLEPFLPPIIEWACEVPLPPPANPRILRQPEFGIGAPFEIACPPDLVLVRSLLSLIALAARGPLVRGGRAVAMRLADPLGHLLPRSLDSPSPRLMCASSRLARFERPCRPTRTPPPCQCRSGVPAPSLPPASLSQSGQRLRGWRPLFHKPALHCRQPRPAHVHPARRQGLCPAGKRPHVLSSLSRRRWSLCVSTAAARLLPKPKVPRDCAP